MRSEVDVALLQVWTRMCLVGLAACTALLTLHFSLPTSIAYAAPCTNSYGSGASAPIGYAVAWNPLTAARELLVEGTECTTSTATVKVGSGAQTQLVYNKGYLYTGSAWQEYTLTGSSALQGNAWYTGNAQASIQLPQQVTYVVGYVCQQSGSAWKCGCRDATCATSYWQLQAVRGASTQTGSGTSDTGGGTGSTGGGTTTDTGNSGGTTGGSGDGSFTGAGPSAQKRNGATAGISYWTLPNTPNGLKPIMTWGGAGDTPSGTVFVGGMDHKTNSALYRLHNDVLYYVGDAKSASQRVNNWQSGEVAEKFHTRPTWMNGVMYVATMNSSELNNNYLSKRGFHWYGYDIAGNTFTDLSAAEPGGVGAAHGDIVTLTADEKRNVLYGAMHPTGDLYAYYPAQKKTVKLGRPSYGGRALVYPGRWMWVDSTTGRLYFTAGNDAISYYGGSYDPAVFNHVYYYDPGKGFGEMKQWTLRNQRAIDGGQCANGVCYMMDNKGHIFKFTEAGPTFSFVGTVANLPPSSTTDITWVFSVDFARQLAYVVVSAPSTLYEFDLRTGTSRNLGNLESYESELRNYSVLYGHDAWNNGRFFFAALGNNSATRNMMLVAIDPVRFKQAVGK